MEFCETNESFGKNPGYLTVSIANYKDLFVFLPSTNTVSVLLYLKVISKSAHAF